MAQTLHTSYMYFIINTVTVLHATLSAATTKGCCPVIDKNHSKIIAFGYQGSAEITVSAGSCTYLDKKFL